MKFAECLRGNMQMAECTAAELVEASGISKSNISRYLSGKRSPDAEGDVPKRLAEALGGIAHAKGIPFDTENAQQSLTEAAGGIVDFATFPKRLGDVLDTFGVARNRLARFLGFDPSYISRIIAGQRKPADMARFIEGVATYIARNNSSPAGTALAANLVGPPVDELTNSQALHEAIARYLGEGDDLAEPQEGLVDRFLRSLDSFDLNDFLKRVRIDQAAAPDLAAPLPAARTYEGIEQMKQAELDFLRAAALADSAEDVILYSDMPLGEMAEDEEFTKNIVLGMAQLIRRGIFLRNIHDVHRPLDELIMGLEGWLPMYLTGQMGSYYLPFKTNDVFMHFIRSAGTVAVEGEAIAGSQGTGRYAVVTEADDVAYVRRRAEELLAHAKPLLRVFREGEGAAELQKSLRRLESEAHTEPRTVGEGTFKNMTLTVWPHSHAVVEKQNAPKVTLLIEHPALVGALTGYEPTLFQGNED